MNFTYRTAKPNDLEALSLLFIETFIHRDPMTAHLKLTEAEAMDYCAVIFPESFKDGLTILAMDPETRRIAGFITAFKDDISNDPSIVSRLNPRLLDAIADTGDVFDILLAPLDHQSEFKPEEIITLMYAGVHSDYAGNSLSITLLALLLERSAELGFKAAISECTSSRSLKQVLRAGFKELNAVAYSDFGIDAFSGVPGALTLCIKPL